MITAGAICISEVLGKLQVLNLSHNNIGDDGITAIAGALGNSQICELYARRCHISLAGARSLAAGLLVNNSVKRLLVMDNLITVEGAYLILESAVNNEICEEVWIDGEYRNDEEVKKMSIILEHRKIQEVRGCMVVSYNVTFV